MKHPTDLENRLTTMLDICAGTVNADGPFIDRGHWCASRQTLWQRNVLGQKSIHRSVGKKADELRLSVNSSLAERRLEMNENSVAAELQEPRGLVTSPDNEMGKGKTTSVSLGRAAMPLALIFVQPGNFTIDDDGNVGDAQTLLATVTAGRALTSADFMPFI